MLIESSNTDSSAFPVAIAKLELKFQEIARPNRAVVAIREIAYPSSGAYENRQEVANRLQPPDETREMLYFENHLIHWCRMWTDRFISLPSYFELIQVRRGFAKLRSVHLPHRIVVVDARTKVIDQTRAET